MHEQLRKRLKRRAVVGENLGAVLGALVALALVILADRRGLPHKWHTAIYGTIVSFGPALMGNRRQWRRWTFWLSVLTCLAVHTLAMWCLFQYIFVTIAPGILFWLPVACIEAFAVLLALPTVEKLLTGEKQPYTLF